MNIEEYREMVAREAESAQTDQTADDAQTSDETVTDSTTDQTTDTQQEQTEDASKEEANDKFVVDGEEITLDDIRELRKGSLRQADYTKKTQSLAAEKKELAQAVKLFEHLKANPHIAEAVLGIDATPADVKNVFTPLHPGVQRISAMEQELFDLKLQREIDDLQKKYPDFEVVEVLNKASEKQLNNLEDAYKLVLADKPRSQESSGAVDKAALAKEIREQVLKELEQEKATASIISSNDSNASVKTGGQELSSAQLSILPKLGMTKEEYIKWMKPNKR